MNISKQLNSRTLLVVLLATLFAVKACAQASLPEGVTNKVVSAEQSQVEDDFTAEELVILADHGKIKLSFDSLSLQVEFADSFDKRALGLMYRKSLCDDCGMLFQFDTERIASIWMKNTFVPLDLAYISIDGKIVDIKALQPHDLTSVQSSKPVLYALEMNQGWFTKKGIKVGDLVSIEGRVRQPKTTISQ